MYGTITTEVDVYVSDVLDQIDDDALLEEVERRGLDIDPGESDFDFYMKELITALWMKRRLGEDYQSELDKIIYKAIGKII
jgi:hypothetical protein